MSRALRRLVQPGPVAPSRMDVAAGPATALEFHLQPGLTLNEAVAAPLLAAGLEGAAVELRGGALAPFRYVLPARAPDDTHVAYYSATHSPPGDGAALEVASVTFGRRAGAPFIHCHAIWAERDGTRRAGHILPEETVVTEPAAARAWGSAAVAIRAEPDAETNFTLFGPVAMPRGAEAAANGPCIAFARIRPNEDIATALETLCRESGFAAGVLRGSPGSLIGAVFEDGRVVDGVATEVLTLAGVVRPDADGALRARLDVALTDMWGVLHEGRLRRGGNPVCITWEAALEEAAP